MNVLEDEIKRLLEHARTPLPPQVYYLDEQLSKDAAPGCSIAPEFFRLVSDDEQKEQAKRWIEERRERDSRRKKIRKT